MRALRFSTLVVAVFLVVLLARVVHRQNDLREEPTHVDEPSSKKSTHHDGILPSSSVPNDQALHHHNSKKDSANNASNAQESSSQNSTSIPDDKSTSVFSHNTPHSLYRRGFIMMHILKAGGNTVEQHLRDVGWNQQHNNHSIYQAGLGYVWMEQDADIAWYHNFTDNVYLQDKFRGEHTNTLPSWQEFPPQDSFFRIGLVREPCAYMVSVWAFSGKGPHGNLTGRCGGNAAMTNFSHFVQHTTTPHLTWLSYRLAILQAGDNRQHLYYPHQLVIECPDNIPTALLQSYTRRMANFQAHDVADCWVRTEHLSADLQQCLLLYQARRGGQTNLQLKKMETWSSSSSADKNVLVANKGSHRPCAEYYSSAEAESVWQREGHVAEQFGYATCCGGLVNESLVYT